MERSVSLFLLVFLIGIALWMLMPGARAESDTLVVYFSMPEDVDTVDAVAGASIVVKDGEKLGNVQFAAQTIADTLGADLFRLETVQQYPLEHNALVDQAADEQDESLRPELVSLPDVTAYSTVILGYPNWWGDLPMPVYTFLESVDLSGKDIIPFTAHGGSGFSDTVRTIDSLQSGARVWKQGLSISRNAVAGAQQFAAMLPLTVDLWNPAPGFAKAFDLPDRIPDVDAHTRRYHLGGLAYWFDGPSVAIFHNDHLDETIVPVVTLGRITDDVSLFADYGGEITITLFNEKI